ncbi:hypothetical protein [Sphingomonas sp. MMS24-J13]|uniref:hypothetical protein n=1 Tax=Sphingomonas sp. MMS24-J13 TaxID=3238686 RepID=UPI00384B1492
MMAEVTERAAYVMVSSTAPNSWLASLPGFNSTVDHLKRMAQLRIASASPTYSMVGILASPTSADLGNHLLSMFESVSEPEAIQERAVWLKLAESGLAPLSTQKIGVLIDELSACFYEGRFNDVDKALDGAEPQFMSVDAVVTISRITYTARTKLSKWTSFIERAKEEMSKRGEYAVMAGID